MSNTHVKVVVGVEDGQFTLAQSDVAEYRGLWYLEAEVNDEGGYVSATLPGDELLRLADFIRGHSE